MQKLCKNCSVVLTNDNAARKNAKYFRNICKPCNSRRASKYQKDNPEKRRAYINSYVRSIGRVKEYPCDHCGKMCYKKFALAFCSDQCRFLSHVTMSTNPLDCWIWNGASGRGGYGKTSIGSSIISAHRLSYRLFNGEIPDDKLVCHTCDNPSCVKPAHLWIGTGSDNAIDMVNKKRHSHSKIGPLDVIAIRIMAKCGIMKKDIAKKFNVAASHISNVVKKRVWKHIEE